MTNSVDPWHEIEEPSSADHEILRRVGPEHDLDLYRGRLFGGGYFLRLVVDSAPPFQLALPKLTNIAITLRCGVRGRSELTLTLTNPDYLELFRALCADLISTGRFVRRPTHVHALSAFIARLLRWQELLKGRRDGVLNSAQQLGLFGELLVLRDVFLTRTDALAALSAWRGPTGAEQDFQFAGWLFEVKSLMVSSDSAIPISSAHQLDLASGRIGLLHQVFSTSGGGSARGCTLRRLVDDIQEALLNGPSAAVDLFRARLMESGYEPLEEYDVQRLTLSRRRTYEITESFPRIAASDLRPGIGNVRYDLAPAACSAFEIEEGELLRRAFDVT